MPDALTVYAPRVDYDGTTTTLTYRVAADFSNWTDTESGIEYKAEKAAATAGDAKPQSVEALIWQYGVTSPGLFSSTVSGVTAGNAYKLKASADKPHYVIIPLDTSLIKDYLTKKLSTNSTNEEKAEETALVWIEENSGIDEVAPPASSDNWKDGKYEDTGIRIGGLAKPDNEVVFAGTIANFDDGKKVDPAKDVTRLPSIATVFAETYTSTIHFYTGNKATAILAGVAADKDLADAEKAKKWMKDKDNKPALSIVYKWAD
jgi:hypothetical protein